jgi:APA family basic amino acid/polyamine antiporter
VNGGDSSSARLTAWHAGALVVGSMIGTGVFTTSGLLLASLGSRSAVLLVWGAGGLLALMGAAVYAELGAMLPRVGGEYVYLSHAFSPVLGFLSGWIALLVGFAAPIAAGAAAFGNYCHAALPAVPARPAGFALIAIVTLLHARDVVWAGRLQLALTAINLTAIVSFVIAGAWALLAHGIPADAGAAAVPLPTPSAGGIAVALVLVSYSYFGWNAAAYVAAEVQAPQRSLPRALCWGCALVTALYVAINAVFVFALPPAALAGKIEIAHLTAQALFGPAAARGLSALITLILAASVSALAMTGPRVYLAMADDGRFFRVFARRNRHGAPSAGVWLQGGLALALFVTAAFDALMIYVGFTLSLSAAATVAAAAWLRRREPERPRPFRTPAWPLPAIGFCAASLWMAAHAIVERPRESLASAATLALGALLYRLRR